MNVPTNINTCISTESSYSFSSEPVFPMTTNEMMVTAHTPVKTVLALLYFDTEEDMWKEIISGRLDLLPIPKPSPVVSNRQGRWAAMLTVMPI